MDNYAKGYCGAMGTRGTRGCKVPPLATLGPRYHLGPYVSYHSLLPGLGDHPPVTHFPVWEHLVPLVPVVPLAPFGSI